MRCNRSVVLRLVHRRVAEDVDGLGRTQHHLEHAGHQIAWCGVDEERVILGVLDLLSHVVGQVPVAGQDLRLDLRVSHLLEALGQRQVLDQLAVGEVERVRVDRAFEVHQQRGAASAHLREDADAALGRFLDALESFLPTGAVGNGALAGEVSDSQIVFERHGLNPLALERTDQLEYAAATLLDPLSHRLKLGILSQRARDQLTFLGPVSQQTVG